MREYRMARTRVDIVSFIFTCKALSDGTQKTILVHLEITANGDVSVCDYEVTGGPVPGMDEDMAMHFPDNSSMDEETVETYDLANFGGRN